MAEIYIDCEKHKQASYALRRLASDLCATRDGLASVLGFVGDAWQGGASDAFLDANEWTTKEMERLRLELEDLANDIDARVAAFEEAERRAKGML